jgi:parallel beta-helix repeat protein
MPRLLPAILLTLLCLGAARAGSTYYVDAESGADAGPGTDPETAWRTVARVNAAQAQLRPGDRVLFRCGRTYAGPLRLAASGTEELPITYGSYGEGPKPELTGFVTATGWKPSGDGVWEAPLPTCASPIQVVTVDGMMRAKGRHPNAGYLTVRSHAGRTSITDPDLPENPNWAGAEVVIRKYRWVLDRCRVTLHEGHTLTVTSPSTYEPVDGHGYFLQDHPRTLDTAGEWYFDPAARTLRVFFGADGPRSAVRASAVDVLVDASRRTDVTFAGLRLSGANRVAIKLDSSSRITVRDCDIRWSGADAVQGGSVSRFVMEDATIEDTANDGIAFHGGVSRSVVRRVKVHNTGMMPGMGGSGDGTYNALTLVGDDNVIEGFRITNTGYIPVHFSGSRVAVRNGFIDGYASVKDDAGGIYTWTGAADKTRYVDRVVEGNIVLHSRGAPDGAVGEVKGFGIYLDDAASEVDVRGNTVAHTTAGLFLHNARHCRVTGNTFFDNGVQLLVTHDGIVPEPGAETRGIVCTENILVSRTPWQPVLSARSLEDDFSQFGTFEQNVFARPADQTLVVDQGVRDAWPRAYDLDGRRAVTGLDAGSRQAAVAIAPYEIRSLGPNLVANGEFATGPAGASCWSTEKNGEIAWAEGPLDGGCIRHRFKAPFKAPRPSLVLVRSGAGGVAAGKRYLLRFTIRGSAEHGSAGVRLRETERPWADITPCLPVRVDPARREAELLFTVAADRPACDVVWTFNEGDGDFWLDNVSLREATVVEPDPGVFRLDVNESDQQRTVLLEGAWVDVVGNSVVGRYLLGPRASRVLLRKDACLGPK